MAVSYIPKDHHTVTPYLIVPDVAGLIDFLEAAFDATETERHAGPDGRVMHAEVKIGDSFVMMGSSSDAHHPMPAMLHLYVEDVDAMYAAALEAGAESVREVADQPYGDRSGGVRDAQGNVWWLATHVEDVDPDELARRMSGQSAG